MAFPWSRFPPYVRVSDRRRHAQQEMSKLRKEGVAITPVVVEGRKITRTFWGTAWCKNLESYSEIGRAHV